MFADPEKNGRRRFSRRVKAGASIVVAIAAGTFLTLFRGTSSKDSSPHGPDARTGPDAGPPDAGSGEVDIEQHRKGMPVPDNLLE